MKTFTLRKRKYKKKQPRRRTRDLDGNRIYFLEGAKKSWDPSRMKSDGIQKWGGLIGSGRQTRQGTHKKAVLSKLVRLSK
jgi:hypothetical protein